MLGRKFIFSVLIICITASAAFCQTEALKSVINNLALYKEKKDLKYLGNAKKAIDSTMKASPDTLDLEKNVYKALVNSSILYLDSLNKLAQPANLFKQTTQLVDKLSGNRRIYRYQEQIDCAKQYLSNTYIRKAFVYVNKSDFSNSLSLFGDAQRYTPTFVPLIAYLAYTNNKLGNFNTAAKYYSELIDHENVKADDVEAASNIYKALGDTATALNLIEKGRKILPNDKLLLLDQATIYNNKKDYQSLLPLLPALLEIYANNADIAFVAANCYDHLNQYDKAEVLYLRATDLNSSAYEPMFNLGILYLKQAISNTKDNNNRGVLHAAQWLEKANEISPNDTKCLKALQMAYLQTGNSDQINRINNKLKQLTNQ